MTVEGNGQWCVKNGFSLVCFLALIIFDWVLFGLTVFGLALVFDPVGSKRYHDPQETPGESLRQQKATSLWLRRMRWAFCWVRSDEHGHEAFQQIAGKSKQKQAWPSNGPVVLIKQIRYQYIDLHGRFARMAVF